MELRVLFFKKKSFLRFISHLSHDTSGSPATWASEHGRDHGSDKGRDEIYKIPINRDFRRV